MRALGLDVGSKTIGLSLGDAGGLIATAVGVHARQGQVLDSKAIAALAKSEGVSFIVVGLPLELDGREGRRTRAVHRFVEALEPALVDVEHRAEIILWDERFSTVAAERTLLEADLSRAKRKGKIDAVAAQFILQGWLDGRSRDMKDPT